MYIFAEPVTEAQVAEIQSQNDAKIEEFERSILGLNRGDDSETQDTQEDDHKWESIQANVQEAMDKDEMSLKNAVKEQETSAEDTEVQALFDRPEVFEEIGEGDRKDQREPDATRQQETTGEATIGAMVKENARILAEANSSSLAEREEQTAFPSEADKPFLDSIVQELAEVETASESEDVLAMTLTIRNKVNGKFVLRPEKMTAADTWSIEYSLAEVPTQVRARALYQACQIRRKKKLDKDMPAEDADADAVGQYITNLRSISTEGREWRKEQDERDRERPVQMWVQAPGRGDGEDQSLSL